MIGPLEPAETWRERAGRIILDPEDPRGDPLPTPADRRWLWRIEQELSCLATTDMQRQLVTDLRGYLVETCEHHWLHYGESGWTHPDTGAVQYVIPEHRGCLWCNEAEFTGDAANQVARLVLGGEP